MDRGLDIVFFGSSLISAYWNGAATYYRGIIKVLHQQGHSITFFEPEVYNRQAHRDIPDPEYAKVVIYKPTIEALDECIRRAQDADILIKASGVGIFDREIEERLLAQRKEFQQILFWDVDAPATLDRMLTNETDYFRQLVPKFDQILTYGGGHPVESVYENLGAKRCTSIYNAFDPETHYPVEPTGAYTCDLAFLGNRLPDRDSRVEEFFFKVAQALPEKDFILGGSGWEQKKMPKNIRYIGHVPTAEHNAFNCSPRAVLNISRDSMAAYGFSPATRVFEAAGAGACIITDAWEGISNFFEPGKEILVADSGKAVIEILFSLDEATARSIGNAALEKAKTNHTYGHRASQLEQILTGKKKTI
jgi:spore maturation protein CgeB